MEKESRGLVCCSPVDHTDFHLTHSLILITQLCIYVVLLSMRTTAFYAETISGATEMQLPFEGGGKCLTARSSADNG